MALPELVYVYDVPEGSCEISLPSGTTRFKLRFDRHNSLGTMELTGEILLGGAIVIERVQFGKEISASVFLRARWR